MQSSCFRPGSQATLRGTFANIAAVPARLTMRKRGAYPLNPVGRSRRIGAMSFRPVAAAFLLISAAAAHAQGPPQRLDARAAQAIVAGCAAHAAGRGQSHAIAVVDAGGRLVAALRMDGNGAGIMDFA